MTDYIDKLTHSAPEDVREVGTINKLGIRRLNVMAVPERAANAEDIEATEVAALTAFNYPTPFWDCDGEMPVVEPLMSGDYAMLKAANISPEEWEIAVLEDQMEKSK
jgi:hypothetical protein